VPPHHAPKVGGPEPSRQLDKNYSPEQVLVNVYELRAFDTMNQLTAPFIGGALHAGVEVFGREWSFGGGVGPGSGVVCEVPCTNQQHRFRETVVLECTALCDGEVALIIGELLEAWRPEDYHWLHRNCLTFANELCQRLGVGRLPAWIDRFARGAGAVDLSVRGIAESVHNVAAGARGVVLSIAQGPGSCGRCTDARREEMREARQEGQPQVFPSMHEEVFLPVLEHGGKVPSSPLDVIFTTTREPDDEAPPSEGPPLLDSTRLATSRRAVEKEDLDSTARSHQSLDVASVRQVPVVVEHVLPHSSAERLSRSGRRLEH